jgi:hypothetical protein
VIGLASDSRTGRRDTGSFKARDRFHLINGCQVAKIVNRQVDVYTDPGPEGYRSRGNFPAGHAVPVVIDGRQLGQVAVDDILPSQPASPNPAGNGA